MSMQIDRNIIITISIPPELVKKMDEYCEKFRYNRSEYLRHLIRKEVMQDEKDK